MQCETARGGPVKRSKSGRPAERHNPATSGGWTDAAHASTTVRDALHLVRERAYSKSKVRNAKAAAAAAQPPSVVLENAIASQCDIDVLDWDPEDPLDAQYFVRRYVARNRPVLVRGAAREVSHHIIALYRLDHAHLSCSGHFASIGPARGSRPPHPVAGLARPCPSGRPPSPTLPPLASKV